MKNLNQLFMDLVMIDSPSGEEEKMREYLVDWLKNEGFEVRIDKVGNIYACVPNTKPSLMICAHMDTVEPGRGIKPLIRDGYIVSDEKTVLGADNKASIAAIICAVDCHVDSFGQLPNIELVFSVREETGGGIEFFPFEWLQSKRGLIFDYAKDLGSVVLQAPFILNFEVVFEGVSAHASKPEHGVNSLISAMKFVSSLNLGRSIDGKSTTNVGKVISGDSINSIPERTQILGEIRNLDKNDFELQLKNIEKLAQDSIKNSKVKMSFSTNGYCAGYIIDQQSDLVKKLVKLLENELGVSVSMDISTGASDANSFNEAGIEVITISDGVQMPHTKKESISVFDLDRLRKIIVAIMASLN
jgi:tripeptide aminopeptidase